MPFGGTLSQLALALLMGIVGAFRSDHTNLQAAALGAKASFIFGTAFMLFSEKRWWPVTFSMVALVTWVLSGWLVASLGYWVTTRIRRL
jgi:CHASE2 domain-containing sensor protein